MVVTGSTIVVQRDDALLVTPGEGQPLTLAVARAYGQLRSVGAGSYLFDLSPVALWGAAARGESAGDVADRIQASSATPLPSPLVARISETMRRYGALVLRDDHVEAADGQVLRALGLTPTLHGDPPRWRAPVAGTEAGALLIVAARAGWPIRDAREVRVRGGPFELDVALRPYQSAAVDAFLRTGHGLILLPCGAGKTTVGSALAAICGAPVLILSPSRLIGEQWRALLRERSSLPAADIGMLGERYDLPLVTIATYHAATSGSRAADLLAREWSLVIYDEVQSLPANTFRLAAEIRAARRLGLTATLVREDGREREIAALVGPPVYAEPWRELERQGWIAPAECVEVRIPPAATASEALRYRLAVLDRLLTRHAGDRVLVVGSQLSSLRTAARRLEFPVIAGDSSQDDRQRAIAAFGAGVWPVLGMSRIGTLGVDLPEASVLVQISGTWGSRQEEAQRLGRILRPAGGKVARFYTLVLRGSRELEFARRRQRFLVDQGYQYEIIDAATLPRR